MDIGIEPFKDSVGDAFMTLPLLIIGLIFFIGTLTSNIGLLLLFLGHLIVVPAIGFLSNERGLPWSSGDIEKETLDWKKAFRAVFSYIVFFSLHATSLTNLVGDSGISIWAIALLPIFGQLAGRYNYKKNLSAFFFVNPPAWIAAWQGVEESAAGSSKCAMLPGVDAKDVYTTPSDWLSHLSFFFGFIISNAIAIYNEPVPEVGTGGDDDTKATRLEKLQARVNNRKSLCTSIILTSIVVFIVLLIFRFKVACENKIAYTLVPVLIACMTGVSWFSIIYNNCGVRPTDVLGIVQGMIPTNLIDNPIVCMA